MALQLWLPCNHGELNNLGLADIKIPDTYTFNKEWCFGDSLTFTAPTEINIDNFNPEKGFTIFFWFDGYEETFNSAEGDIVSNITSGGQTNVLFSYDDAILLIDKQFCGEAVILKWDNIKKDFSITVEMLLQEGSDTNQRITKHVDYQDSNFTGKFIFNYGAFNDIRIYDNVLTDHQIRMIMDGVIFHNTMSDNLLDVSGFSNHLTCSAELSAINWSLDTPVDFNSMYFDGSYYLSTIPLGIVTSQLMLTFRMKIENDATFSNTIIMSLESNNASQEKLKIGINGSTLSITAYYHNPVNGSGSGTGKTISLDKISDGWHTYAISIKRDRMTIFIDGEVYYDSVYILNGTIFTTVATDALEIGRTQIGSHEIAHDIYLSDISLQIRSAEPFYDHYRVMQRHETRVGIDDGGNLYAYAIDEDTTVVGMDSHGYIHGEIEESENGLRVYPDKYTCTEFIEL